MRRPYIVAAIILAVLTVGWRFGLGPRWTMRFPRDGVFSTKYVGTQTNADSVTGVIPKADALSTYDRSIRVMDAADWPRSVMLIDKYTVRDIQIGTVLYEYATKERIDPRTGALADGPHKGEIVLFPRNVQKRDYTMRSNYMTGVRLKFSGENDVDGLNTYKFTYRGRLDLTEAFAGTVEFPGIAVPAGQDVHCADDQFYYRIWIEPLTGEQAKVEEGCLSGDYIYETASGKQVAAIDRWNGETSGAGLAARITEVFDARRMYSWAAIYIPGILVAGCLGCLFAGFWRRNAIALA